MAKLIGLDIRTRYVRAVALVTSYRKVSLEATTEVDRTQFGTSEEAIRACLIGLLPHSDGLAVALDGDQAFLHRLELPKTAEKQIAEVIRFELEAQVPVDIDDLVHDWAVLPRTTDGPIDVLVAAARQEHVAQRIEMVSRAVSRQAERVGIGALPLANLLAVTPGLDGDEPLAIVDLDDDRTEVVVVQGGRPVFARTLSVGISGLPRTAPDLAARLRQTLAAANLRSASGVHTLWLTGAGAAASGAETYLAAELSIPVMRLPPPSGLGPLSEDQIALSPRFARALGLALGLRGRPRDLDLRRGALSYQHSYAFLKERAPVLVALGATLLLSFFFSSWAELRSLGREREALTAEIAQLSREALGEETSDPDRVRELLDGLGARSETDPMPRLDGFDVMVELSKAVPVSIVHDVEELDVSREHAKIRGIVGSAAEAQQIADALKQSRCFADPKITKVSQVVNGTRQKYVLECDLKCPEETAGKKKAEAEEAEKKP